LGKPLSADQSIRLAKSHARKGEIEQARQIYQALLEKFPENKKAIEGLRALSNPVLQPNGAGHNQNPINDLIGLYTQGRLEEALTQGVALARQYQHAPLIANLLGAIYTGLGREDEAVASYHRALTLKPDYVEAHYNLGVALDKFGRHAEAVTSYGRALALKPDYAEAHYNLGVALDNHGKHEEAVASYHRALELKPGYVQAHNNLGSALKTLGRYEEAVASYRRALELKPDDAGLYYNLGVALDELDKHMDALACYQRALEINPDSPATLNNLGVTLNDLGRPAEAIACYKKALALTPGDAELYYNLGVSFMALGKPADAVACYQRALEISPDSPVTLNNLGIALDDLDESAEAAACYHRALTLKPDYAEAHHGLGNVLFHLGKHEEAAISFHRAFSLDENHILARGAWLHQLAQICDWDQLGNTIKRDLNSLEFGPTPKEVASPFSLLALVDDPGFHRRVSEAFAFAKYKPRPLLGPLPKRPHKERIRIGYFSNDFHNHPVMYLMAELFEKHDRAKFEVHAFSFGPDKKDEMRSRLQNNIEVFHDVRLKGDAEIASMSRSLGIDIAVDLTGYTGGTRAGIFSYRAAPIQVNYLGYPGTMGAPYMDYIIADKILIPPANQEFYSEKVAYLPDCFMVNDSTREISGTAMSRADFGLPEGAFVFCCFNNSYKITPDVFDIWMRLLDKIEGSVLWLSRANESAEKNLRNEAQRRGISGDRLIFAERMTLLSEHLARQRLADLFIDTFNYNAHTTASDALWAGLPVLTKLGKGFASRVAGSLLTAVGLPELITTTVDDYERRALELATQPQQLAEIRVRLARNLNTAPLFDTALFAKHIESAYTHMVRHLNEGLEPEHFYVKD